MRGAEVLRAAVVALLLANVLFFAWSRGWLGEPPRHGQSEPGRMAAQVRPEALKVLPPKAATAAVQAARAQSSVCLEAGPFSGAGAQVDLGAAESALAQAQLPSGAWARSEPPAVPVWLVFAGRYPDPPLRASREEDLRKLGLAFERIDEPADLAPGFVLSRHGARADAEAWIKLAPAGLRGVRIVQLPAPPPLVWLRVARADAEMAERLRALPAGTLAGGFRPCAARS